MATDGQKDSTAAIQSRDYRGINGNINSVLVAPFMAGNAFPLLGQDRKALITIKRCEIRCRLAKNYVNYMKNLWVNYRQI